MCRRLNYGHKRNRERLKGYSRANEALVTRNNKKKITDLAISVVPGPGDAAGIEMSS